MERIKIEEPKIQRETFLTEPFANFIQTSELFDEIVKTHKENIEGLMKFMRE